MTAMEGCREIEAARLRHAAAKRQVASVAQLMASAKKEEEAEIEAARLRHAAAARQVASVAQLMGSAKKEEEAAAAYLKETEKRREVIEVDLDSEDAGCESDAEDDNYDPEKKRRKTSMSCLRLTFSERRLGIVLNRIKNDRSEDEVVVVSVDRNVCDKSVQADDILLKIGGTTVNYLVRDIPGLKNKHKAILATIRESARPITLTFGRRGKTKK